MKKIMIGLMTMLSFTTLAFAGDIHRFAVQKGQVTFKMTAPVEEIVGATEKVESYLDVTRGDLSTLKGYVEIPLTTLKTSTFNDNKDKMQTEHMLNWFELGPDVSTETREQYKNAVLNVSQVKVHHKQNETTSHLIVNGDLTIHGIKNDVVLELTVEETSKGFHVTTAKPVAIRLSDYDVKPRDTLGKLMQKTLASMSDKVAQEAMVSVDLWFK